MTRVGAGIRQNLMTLIKALGELQGRGGAETKAVIGLTLKAGQIVKQWRELRGRLAFLGNDAWLTQAFIADGFRPFLVPQPLRPKIRIAILLGTNKLFIKPLAGVFARFSCK